MKLRSTLIFAAIVIALGIVLVFHVGRQPSDRVYRQQQQRVFPAEEFQPDRSEGPRGLSALATRLELRHGEDRIALVRVGDGDSPVWRIESPVQAEADSQEVTKILVELEMLDAQAALRDEPERMLAPSLYGLDKPARSVVFAVAENSWELDIGEATADGKSLYAQRSGLAVPTVFILSKRLLASVDKSVGDLRDKAVLRAVPARIAAVEFQRNGQPRVVCRRAESEWQVAEPVRDSADVYVLSLVLGSLLNVRIDAADFITEDATRASEFGLTAPIFALTVVEESPDRRQTLLIGSPVAGRPGKVYAKRADGPSIFALQQRDVAGWEKTLEDVRARNVLQFNPDGIVSIQISVDGQRIQLSGVGGEWRLEGQSLLKADSVEVRNFLNDLNRLAVQKWLDAPTPATLDEAGLSSPGATVRLATADGAAREIHFGKTLESPGLCYARRGRSGPVLLVPYEIIQRIARGPLAFVSAVVMQFTRADATRLVMARPDGEFSFERVAEGWIAKVPTGADAIAGRVDAVLWELCHLEAKSIAASSMESPLQYGFDAPRARVTVVLGGATGETKTLILGKECDAQGHYVMVEGAPLVYLVGRSTVEVLLAPLVAPAKDGGI